MRTYLWSILGTVSVLTSLVSFSTVFAMDVYLPTEDQYLRNYGIVRKWMNAASAQGEELRLLYRPDSETILVLKPNPQVYADRDATSRPDYKLWSLEINNNNSPTRIINFLAGLTLWMHEDSGDVFDTQGFLENLSNSEFSEEPNDIADATAFALAHAAGWNRNQSIHLTLGNILAELDPSQSSERETLGDTLALANAEHIRPLIMGLSRLPYLGTGDLGWFTRMPTRTEMDFINERKAQLVALRIIAKAEETTWHAVSGTYNVSLRVTDLIYRNYPKRDRWLNYFVNEGAKQLCSSGLKQCLEMTPEEKINAVCGKAFEGE